MTLVPAICAVALLAAPAAAGARLIVGISDNGTAMFGARSFRHLHVTTARAMVYWNVAVMRDKLPLQAITYWLADARAAHVTPMVTFSADPGRAGDHVPGIREYTRAVRAFVRDFPWVKVYTPWNEPDFIYRGLARRPALAAGYFNVLIRVCHHCTVVAGDVYRPAWQGLAAWVRAYRAHLHARPAAWALHPYDDIRGRASAQLRAFERVTSGPIWLTEVSGVERRVWKWRNQSPAGANRDERFLFSLPERFHRITRIYHYQWQAVRSSTWDSALLGPGGKPRPAYWTVANAVRGRLP